MLKEYEDLARLIGKSGYFSSFRPDSGAGVLVCTEKKDESGRLCGKSFKVYFHEDDGHWYFFTWAPAIYRVPIDLQIGVVCLQILRRNQGMASVNSELVEELKLEKISYDDYCAMRLNQDMPDDLMRIFEAQKDYHRIHKRFAESLNELWDGGALHVALYVDLRDLPCGYDVVIEATTTTWTATARSTADDRGFQIDQTGRVRRWRQST